MRMIDEGHSVHHVAKVLHIGTNTIKLIRRRYLYGGELALLQPKYQPHLDVEKKAMILTDIDKKIGYLCLQHPSSIISMSIHSGAG